MFTLFLSEVFYRPVLNLLFGLHGLLPPEASFGLTIVAFTILLRALLTVATSSQSISETQQEQLDAAITRIEAHYANDPVKQKTLVGKLMRENSFSIVLAALGMLIQVIVILCLYRLFTHDLRALDRLLYSFLSVMDVNFRFLGINLAEPSGTLALLTAILLFLYLTFSTISLLSLTTKSKAFQYLIPLITYFFLTRLPGAVGLFLLTSTLFSLILFASNNLLTRFRRFALQARLADDEARQAAAAESDS